MVQLSQEMGVGMAASSVAETAVLRLKTTTRARSLAGNILNLNGEVKKKRKFFVMGLKEIGVFRIYKGRKIRKKCHVVRETHLSSFCEEWKKRVSFYHRNVYET